MIGLTPDPGRLALAGREPLMRRSMLNQHRTAQPSSTWTTQRTCRELDEEVQAIFHPGDSLLYTIVPFIYLFFAIKICSKECPNIVLIAYWTDFPCGGHRLKSSTWLSTHSIRWDKSLFRTATTIGFHTDLSRPWQKCRVLDWMQ